ncbi:AAA family ATPase [Lysinibacillus capsici]|uniref:AAA family ATPase n=1 Tax=Lysinibacillus capsici TaxID=2115968 RepID=UPI0032DEAF1F
MRIHYIWFREFKSLRNFQANFGSELIFNFDNVGTLTVTKNEVFVSNFHWNKNNNKNLKSLEITAVVGENGAGKSTILEFLTYLMKDNLKTDYIIIYSKDNILYKSYSLNNDIEIEGYQKGNIKTLNYYDPNHLVIFYSNVFDVRYLNSESIEDTDEIKFLSTNVLLDRHENVLEYLNEELQRQIFFVSKYNKDLKLNDIIKLPDTIQMELIEIKELSEYTTIGGDWENNKIFNIPKFQSTKYLNKEFKKSYLNLIYTAIGKEIDNYRNKNNLNLNFNLSKIMYDIVNSAKSTDEFFGNLYEVLKLKFNLNKDFLNVILEITKKYKLLIDTLSKLNVKIKKDEVFDGEKGDSKYIEYLEMKPNNISVEKFITTYSDIIKDTGLFRFTWKKMSSGQFSFLTLLSRFAYAIDKENNHYKSYLLLIDEGDLYFHPQLQKDWLYHFSKAIEIIFNGHVQVILTTHSPLVLSDIPNTNVVFLSNIEDKLNNFFSVEGSPRTFAANISELFSNSFFIKDGLIGKFAKERINDCIRWLLNASPKEVYQDRDSILKFIDLIGEPILKNKVYDIYLNKIKLFEPNQLAEMIEVFEQKLNELKKIKEMGG